MSESDCTLELSQLYTLLHNTLTVQRVIQSLLAKHSPTVHSDQGCTSWMREPAEPFGDWRFPPLLAIKLLSVSVPSPRPCLNPQFQVNVREDRTRNEVAKNVQRPGRVWGGSPCNHNNFMFTSRGRVDLPFQPTHSSRLGSCAGPSDLSTGIPFPADAATSFDPFRLCLPARCRVS